MHTGVVTARGTLSTAQPARGHELAENPLLPLCCLPLQKSTKTLAITSGMLVSTQNLPAACCCSAARAPVNSPTAFQIKASQLEALLGVGFKVLQLSPKKNLICFHPLCSLTDIYRPLGSFV